MEKIDLITEFFVYEEMKKGKEYVFNYFFNYYYPGLCVFAQKIISLPEQQAKDIVQDVFVKFWNDREKLDIPPPLQKRLIYGQSQLLN